MTRVLYSSDDQEAMKTYIENNGSSQYDDLNQALNDAYIRNGKFSAHCKVEKYGEVEIRHASAGDKRKKNGSATVFYFRREEAGVWVVCLIAVGTHHGRGYKIDATLGQDEMPFQKGKKVGANGKVEAKT